jgi:hypothetical protein
MARAANVSIDDWQTKFEDIYPNAQVSPDTMMVHVFTWCGELGRRIIRDTQYDRSETTVPAPRDHSILKATAWIIALCNHYGINYSSALIGRFPHVCPYCLSKPCACDTTGRKAIDKARNITLSQEKARLELEALARSYDSKSYNFDSIISMIKSVYPANRSLLMKGGNGYVVSKFLEEGGELKAAYSQLELAKRHGSSNKDEFLESVKEEISDLTAWLFSCWDLSQDGQSFDSGLSQMFKLGCTSCRRSPCECIPYYSSIIVSKAVERFRNDLRSIDDPDLSPSFIAAQNLAHSASQVGNQTDIQRLAQEAEAIRAQATGPDLKRALESLIDRLSLSHLPDA